MKKTMIITVLFLLLSSTLVTSTALNVKKTNPEATLIEDDPERVDKIIVAFKEVGGEVRWEKYIQDVLGLPPFPIFLYIITI